jgi:hypothetical protein
MYMRGRDTKPERNIQKYKNAERRNPDGNHAREIGGAGLRTYLIHTDRCAYKRALFLGLK